MDIPDEFEASLQRGMALVEEGKFGEAIACYNMAIMLEPDKAQGYYLRGKAIAANEKPDEALRSYLQAAEIDPAHAEGHAAAAAILSNFGRFADAAAQLDKAIAAEPLHANHYNNKGLALNGLRKHGKATPADALACFDEAVRLDPAFSEAWNNRGIMLQLLRRYDEALVSYNTALEHNPDGTHPKFHKSTLLLLHEQFEEAWPLFEHRTKVQGMVPRSFSNPMPVTPGSLTGRRVLLFGEQGRGDVIQFCRYAPMVAALGAEVTLQVHAALVPLLSTLEGVTHVMALDAYVKKAHFTHLLMTLPFVFKTTKDNIPAAIPYLSIDPVKRALWQARLGPREKKRIGLVWEGSNIHPNNFNRSIGPAAMVQLLRSTDATFYSLNKESSVQLPGVIDLTRDLRDFAETAAFIGELDLVITVDTAVAHLAGALGRPVWIMLPYAPDFRWLAEGSTSKWYPSARLFRQKQPGDWEGVITEISAALGV